MMSVNECLTDESNIYLIKGKYIKLDENNHICAEKTDKKIYIKNFNSTEFIGEELCHIKNIPSAHYFLVGINYSHHRNQFKKYSKLNDQSISIKLGSFDFKKDGLNYFKIPYDLCNNPNTLEKTLSLCPNKEKRNELLDEIIDMFALDIYMGQQDRNESNIMFYQDKNNYIHLAPLYDFEFSLNNALYSSKFLYDNDLYKFKDINTIKEFISSHERLKYELESYLDINLLEIARKSYNERDLKIPSVIEEHYTSFDHIQKKLIKRIVK